MAKRKSKNIVRIKVDWRGRYSQIKSTIWKNNKDKYPEYFNSDLSKIASLVYQECKTVGTNCDDIRILEIHNEIFERGGNRPAPPEIIDFNFDPRQYYEIKDVVEFLTSHAFVWFYSPLIIAAPNNRFRSIDYVQYFEVNGQRTFDVERGYRKYWKEWVDWCNRHYRSQSPSSLVRSEDVNVYFKFLQPVPTTDGNGWVVEITPCRANGDIDDFGFVPQGLHSEHSADEFIEPTIAPEPEPTTISQIDEEPITTETPSDREREVRIKKIEADIRKLNEEIDSAIKKDKLDRLLKMKEDARSDIKLWKEIDDAEELTKAKDRFKQITKEIDELR